MIYLGSCFSWHYLCGSVWVWVWMCEWQGGGMESRNDNFSLSLHKYIVNGHFPGAQPYI